MKLCGLPKLTFISSNGPISMGTVEFGSLFRLEIINCGSLKGLGRTMSFKMLKHLIVVRCNQLRYVLPLYVLQTTLRQLEEIVIKECDMLENIFGDEEGAQVWGSNTIHKLPQVKSLILEKLPKCSGLCQEGCMVEWLSLKKVKVIECDTIHKSSLGIMKRSLLTSPPEVDKYDIAHYFEFLDEVFIAEELKIKGSEHLKKYMKMKPTPFSFSNLRTFEAKQCNQEMNKLLPILFHGSHSLENLKIESCNIIEQIFDLQYLSPEQPPQILLLPKIQSMSLCGLSKLTYISNNGPISMGTVEFGSSFKLEITDCGSLKGPGRTMCFKMLKHLVVVRCSQLRYVFPLNVLQTLPQLEEIVIIECEVLERVFGDEEDTQMMRESNTVHQLPQVRSLIIEKLPKFSGFCQNRCMVEWLSLNKVKVVECDSIEKSSLGMMKRSLLTSVEVDKYDIAYHFEFLDEVSKAKKLKIKGSEHLKKYMEMKPHPSSFSNLRTLEASHCDQEINILLPILFRGSHGLEDLTIENCETMEQVFDLGDLAPNIPNLHKMRLYGLPKLNCIWNVVPELQETIEFGNRVELEIIKCGVKGPLSTSLLDKLVQLKIESCDKIEQVMDMEKEAQHILLHNLEDLQLINLEKLSKFYSGNYILTFPNLRTLRIEKCPQLNAFKYAPSMQLKALLFIPALSYGKTPLQNLETIKIVDCNDITFLFAIKGDMLNTYSGLLPNLRQLHLQNLGNFQSILAPKHHGRTLSFEMLNELIVYGCNQMRYVLPLHVIQNLQQLKVIEIRNCDKLERIFDDEEVTEKKKPNSTLPRYKRKPDIIDHKISQVECLILEKLPKFHGCYQQDKVNVEWLSLKKVRVVECPMIQKSSMGKIDRHLLTYVDVTEGNTWANNEDKESNIKYLFELTGKLYNMKILEIKDSEELMKFMEMELKPSSFRSLRTLKATKCNVQLNNFLSALLHLSNGLKELIVENCEMLEQVFDLKEFVEKQGNLKFPNLNTMKLLGLPNLKWIWNNDPREILGLNNLVNLEIIECGLLRSPISTSLLEKLDSLKALKIKSCDMIEQIVEDDLEMQKRIFHNLEDLELVNLPKLTKFNSGHCNFKFPNLLRLTIENCPQLDAFTIVFLSNQVLTVEGTTDQVPPNENMDACPKLEKLKLVGHETLGEIWLSNNIRDCELKEVEVDSFNNLKYIFPSTMLPFLLKKLETLIVRNCTSLSNVFESITENDSSVAFENLKIMKVKGCDSLQHLLLPASTYPKLTEIDISECQSLEEIFIESKVDSKSFLNLESIILENLQALSSLSLEIFRLSKLQKARIVKCPAIKTFSINGSPIANDFVVKILAGSQPVGNIKKILQPKLQELRDQTLEFKNLTTLEIIGCGSIEKLFPISAAEHLSSLKSLTLYNCEHMVQVIDLKNPSDVHGGRGRERKKLVFKKLETLVLKHMSRLTSFCEEEEEVDSFEFPELKIVRVEVIPKMETFVKRPFSTPKLKQVQVTFLTRWWLEDLNNTIRYMHDHHDKLEKEFWKSDQSSTRQHTYAVESSSQGKSEI